MYLIVSTKVVPSFLKLNQFAANRSLYFIHQRQHDQPLRIHNIKSLLYIHQHQIYTLDCVNKVWCNSKKTLFSDLAIPNETYWRESLTMNNHVHNSNAALCKSKEVFRVSFKQDKAYLSPPSKSRNTTIEDFHKNQKNPGGKNFSIENIIGEINSQS